MKLWSGKGSVALLPRLDILYGCKISIRLCCLAHVYVQYIDLYPSVLIQILLQSYAKKNCRKKVLQKPFVSFAANQFHLTWALVCIFTLFVTQPCTFWLLSTLPSWSNLRLRKRDFATSKNRKQEAGKQRNEGSVDKSQNFKTYMVGSQKV
jgi:hypothetical protein